MPIKMRGACSSAGEHYVDIVGVTGSIPTPLNQFLIAMNELNDDASTYTEMLPCVQIKYLRLRSAWRVELCEVLSGHASGSLAMKNKKRDINLSSGNPSYANG